MRISNMSLFPAFLGATSKTVEHSSKELDWLTNKSFRSDDALSLHQQALEKASEGEDQRQSRITLSSSEEEEDENKGKDDPPKKKKKKEKKKKKKKKKHRKKSAKSSESSGSESDTIYPSDLKNDQRRHSPQSAPVPSVFRWLDDIQPSDLQLFCLDRKADLDNWTYRSLYRGNIARYRRKCSSALGLDSRTQEVSWAESESDKKQKGADRKKGEVRYFSSTNRKRMQSEPPLPTLPRAPEAGGTSQSFIPVGVEDDISRGGGVDRAGTSPGNPLGVYDASTALWLQGKGLQAQADCKEREAEAAASAAPLAGRTEYFNRRLRERPTDTQLWIEFINYQEEQSSAAFGEAQGGGTYRAVLEKKLSVAERAVASNPTSVLLQLERLKVCRELWEPPALAKEWKKLVFLHPNSAPLWRKYLQFTQSHFSTFTVPKVNAAYGKCLSTLSAVQDGSMVSHPVLPGTQEEMLDIFVLQCNFLRQAGHSEKAISMFQALVDFTFFTPDSVAPLSTREQVEFFEPFWDSGEGRVGEDGARGWRAWMHQQERGGWLQPSKEEEEEEEEEDEEVKDQSKPRWRIWLDVESSREAAHWLPWRPDKSKGQSEEDCEDPDRQELFDDIGPSLIRLTSPDLRLRLVLHFLSFLGLPVDAELCGRSCKASLLLDSLSLLLQGNDPQRLLTSQDLTECGVSSVGHMTTLQGTRKWVGLGKQGEEFVTNVFQMLLPLLPTQQRAMLSLCWMRYEKLKVLRCVQGSSKKRLRTQGKSSKRVAKRLLKQPENRSLLPLWREYAHLEWLLGNREDSRKVFTMATGMGGAKGLGNPALCELCVLWAQLEVEGRGEEQEAGPGPSAAIEVLSRLAEGSSSSSSSSSTQALSPVTILKARRSYEQALTSRLTAFENHQWEVSTSNEGEGTSTQQNLLCERLKLGGLVGCYALFQYLTVSIQAANTVYSQARDTLEALRGRLKLDYKNSSSSREGDSTGDEACKESARRLAWECEMLAVQQVMLLNYHTCTSVFPLATLRQTLTSSLSAWSNSAPLWSIYIQVENRYHSAGRARRFFHSVTRGNNNVVPRLFAIVAEQQRKQLVDSAQRSGSHGDILPTLPENGLSNRIRGLFESAIATEQGACCPLVWRMYLHFLVSEGKPERAKGIFYKALQHVPWAKGLYMDAVQLFPDHLQEFVDLMTEKELRVRLPLEELDLLLED